MFYKNIENNTIYKIGLVAVNDEEMSDINIKEFEKANLKKIQINILIDLIQNIMCDSMDNIESLIKCQSNKHDIIATKQIIRTQISRLLF